MKRIELLTGFLENNIIPYSGQYIYKVIGVREGLNGLGEGYPQPEFFEIELEGVGGIQGKMEKTKAITKSFPLDCRNHKYYLLEHNVWVKNLGDLKYVSDWTPSEVWALAVLREYDENDNPSTVRELGFAIIHSDRGAGIVL